MKRYIRTKNGKIIDFNKIWVERIIETYAKKEFEELNDEYVDSHNIEVVKQADTIEELITCGDLIGIFNGSVEKVDSVEYFEERQEFQFYSNGSSCYWTDSNIVELYIKQGDNYILVWDKERGVI